MAVEGKMRWGDMCDDDDEGEYNIDFLLPPRQLIGPDNKAMKKKVVQCKLSDKVKSKQVVERRLWPKFGDAVANDDVGATMVSTEVILLEPPAETKAEVGKGSGYSLGQLGKGGAVLMVCRSCGKKGDHWTARCPYKDVAVAPQGTSTGASGTGNKGTYVPPSQRGRAERSSGSDLRRRNDENSVRVSNLSEDTREADLQELFRPFGAVSRVYVAADHKNGMSRGFGFVNFVNKGDAQRAINKLNGYGYDNLILSVEWATPTGN